MVKERIDGFFLIDKPIGWTSQDVCNKIKHRFKLNKVGHSGTLDPFASGLLVVAMNNATKLLPYVSNEPKTYLATLKLGEKTNTGDLDGELVEKKEIPNLSISKIEEVLNSMLGDIEQIPPMTSAIHVGGIKLYELAHQGIEIERKPRKIHVFSLKLINFEDNLITFECAVSSGTYVRVLGEDIASKLDTVGHLVSLRRTKIKDIDIKDALLINDIQIDQCFSLDNFVDIPRLIVKEENLKKAIHGNPIVVDKNKEDMYLVIGEINNVLEVIAIYKKKDDKIYVCERGIYVDGNH